jgi:hypothetical protein
LCKSKELICNIWSVCQQCSSLCATAYAPDSGTCDTETCHVVVEGYEIGVVKPGTALKDCLCACISSLDVQYTVRTWL